MKTSTRKALCASFFIVLLSGFAVGCTKQQIGATSGAAIGGLAGSQFGSGAGQTAATIFGAGAGALIGSEVGKTMDKVDQNY